MQGTVQKRFVSKKGTPCLEIGGQVYIAPKVDIGHVQIGDSLSFEGHAFGDGKMWELDSYRLLEPAKKYPTVDQPSHTNAAPMRPVEPERGITEAERIFAYGVVTESIKAGLIKDRADLGIWAKAAVEAIRFAGQPVDIP